MYASTSLSNQPLTTAATKRSRCEYLVKRNADLVTRFYYWFEVRRTRIDDVYVVLAAEFYLSPITVEKLIRQNSELLDNLYKK